MKRESPDSAFQSLDRARRRLDLFSDDLKPGMERCKAPQI
jgi:hypothetical protein